MIHIYIAPFFKITQTALLHIYKYTNVLSFKKYFLAITCLVLSLTCLKIQPYNRPLPATKGLNIFQYNVKTNPSSNY